MPNLLSYWLIKDSAPLYGILLWHSGSMLPGQGLASLVGLGPRVAKIMEHWKIEKEV